MFKNKTVIVVIAMCIVKLTLHLIADYNSGFQADEFLHIETGHHPAMGYMEFPPAIGWLAFIQNLFHSQSVFIHHIFTHIAAILIMVICAMITIALGGKTKAVFMLLLCIIVAPAFGRSQQLFQPVVFSQLFWLLSFLQLVHFVKTVKTKYILYLALSLTAGFLTKYDIVFFIAGLTGLLFFKETRTALLKTATLKYVLLSLLIISPNIYWQIQHQFPVLQMFSRLYETQLNKLSVADVFKNIFISLNPFTAVFWIAGLLFMFNKKDKFIYRPIVACVLLSICFLALSKSKAYYFYPAIITLMIFGSIWFEQNVLSKRSWIIYPAAFFLLASGVIMVPFGLAVLPVNSFIKFTHLKKQDGNYQVDYEEYYSRSKWQKTLTVIEKVFDSLPVQEQQHCLIWGKHYSQAGAVNLFGKDYHLPEAFSYHGSFYLWAPKGEIPPTVIAFTNDEATIDFFKCYFNDVVAVEKVFNPYAKFAKDYWQTIYVCKAPKQNFAGLKKIFEKRVFE